MVITGTSVVSGNEVRLNRQIQRHGVGVESENRISDSDLSGLRNDHEHWTVCKVVHTWQVDSDRFNSAELHIRYFPDAALPTQYFDTMVPIRD